MGILSIILGDRLNLKDKDSAIAITGDHQLDRHQALGLTDPGALNPMNGGKAFEQNIRRVAVLQQPRDFSVDEANAIEQNTAVLEHRTQHGIRALRALTKAENLDAAYQRVWRQYQEALASGELAKIQANFKLLQALQRMRPEYARMGLESAATQNQASHRVQMLKCKIAGVLA